MNFDFFWGKFCNNEQTYHPLVHHCADVAVTFEILCRLPSIERALYCAANAHHHFNQPPELPKLPATLISRLAVFVFLHDLGKIALGFQYQVHSPPPANSPPSLGHIKPFANLLWCNKQRHNKWLIDAIGLPEILAWPAECEETPASLLMAALAHHGKPVKFDNSAAVREQRQWKPDNLLNPRLEANKFGKLARAWFPEAFEQSGVQLPGNPAFHHLFAGLVALADWIGSDGRHFKFEQNETINYIDIARNRAQQAVDSIGLNITEQRQHYNARQKPADIFGFNKLRPLQEAVASAPLDKQALILEAETGAGKTEAALLRFKNLYENGLVDGMYFAVPTRSAAIQLQARIDRFIKTVFDSDPNLPVVLAVPGFYQAGSATGRSLPDFLVEWDDTRDSRIIARRWAAESNKRYLAAQIAVGTIDQIMLSELPAKHAHMRSALLARNLLVIDELHASDQYMKVVLEHVLKTCMTQNSHVLMMSATLGAEARMQWLLPQSNNETPDTNQLSSAISAPYPSISFADQNEVIVMPIKSNDRNKTIRLETSLTEQAIWLDQAKDAAMRGAKVLVIRNTVKEAVRTFNHLHSSNRIENNLLFQLNGVPTLHHSRFSTEDRVLLDKQVECWLGKDRKSGGAIVVGTQTLEQSLDIDADILFTDLCPMDVLLQRIGRLHRHNRTDRPAKYSQAKAIILTPHKNDLTTLLQAASCGLGASGRVYTEVDILQNTLNLINSHPVWKVPEMNRFLVEQTLHSEAINTLLATKNSEWHTAHAERTGEAISDQQTAQQSRIRKDKLFTEPDVLFAEGTRVLTRLGGDKLTVVLENPCRGPFGTDVTTFSIPDWMLDADLAEYIESPEVVCKEFFIYLKFPSQTLIYGPEGLQKTT